MSNRKIALVTGANRGLGLETARQLAAEGVTVLMAGRDQASIESAAASVASEHVHPVVLDITDDAQIEAVRAWIEQEHGHLDILVNNAGIITGETFFENSARTIGRDALRKTFEVNLISQIVLTQALLPLLERAEEGRIVNVSSILGSITANRDYEGDYAALKPVAYNTSKAALNMWTVALGQSLSGTRVKVNSAHPGWVKTELGTDAAPMEVDDGARTAVALALLDAEGPTGHFVHQGDDLPW